jgi:allophanate hydrolase subunit 2
MALQVRLVVEVMRVSANDMISLKKCSNTAYVYLQVGLDVEVMRARAALDACSTNLEKHR